MRENLSNWNDTIVALASAPGIGAIAVIRLSGPASIELVGSVFSKKNLHLKASHTVHFGKIIDGAHIIDEVVVTLYKAPKSYTGEEVVEISCHGSPLIQDTILQLFILKGARLAKPGEFTQRAFLNGKLDLTQAEAIASLIEAKSDDAAKILARQMRGDLKEYIEKIRDSLLEILAYSEVVIDYAEEDLPENILDQIIEKLRDIVTQLQKTLDSSRRRSGLVQGYRVAIIGKPNVGKSSLLNAIAGETKSLVDEVAGTTRDPVDELIEFGGSTWRFVDTAGIRKRANQASGTDYYASLRTASALDRAEVAVIVLDASIPLTEQGLRVLTMDEEAGRAMVLVMNKWDLVDEDRQIQLEKLLS